MSRVTKIPDATIERIALYTRSLERLMEEGTLVVSSERLAELCRVNPPQVRRDLCYFGEFGVRGVGYNVRGLLKEIEKILVLNRKWNLGIVGLGNMGMALLHHHYFSKRNFRFVGAFDSDPKKIGKKLSIGLIIQPVGKIKELTEELGIDMGIIATPASQSQGVASMLFEAGVRAILNFSPIQVRKPECCLVENVDFTVNLDNLAYHLNRTE
jgi:redox-sensing transcriptional repressor